MVIHKCFICYGWLIDWCCVIFAMHHNKLIRSHCDACLQTNIPNPLQAEARFTFFSLLKFPITFMYRTKHPTTVSHTKDNVACYLWVDPWLYTVFRMPLGLRCRLSRKETILIRLTLLCMDQFLFHKCGFIMLFCFCFPGCDFLYNTFIRV